jgi:Peptidase family M28
MEAARPSTRRLRRRRGTVERPVNTRLVRVAAVVVVPAFLAFLFSISTTGTLPRPTLQPLFDRSAAASLASQLTAVDPSRVPGTFQDAEAARWYQETVSTFGFQTGEDHWEQDLPDLGHVQLRNIVTVVPGRSPAAIVLVAHRDNTGVGQRFGDNASGTAALIEIARGFAPQATAPAPLPERTLVLVSTDGGAYGGAGAARFAETSPYARQAVAVIVLDGIGGTGRPRIALAGDEPRSPAPALVSTALARVREQTGATPALPSVPSQLLDLGLPYAGGEQGRFLARGIAAVTLTTQQSGDPIVPVGDQGGAISIERLGQMGRATEALVGSLDENAGSSLRTPDSLFFRDRAASGWAARLTLIVAVVPFAIGALDLLVRSRRRKLPLGPALRCLRSRLFFWIYAGILLWLGTMAGVFPSSPDLPPPPYAQSVVDLPVPGLLLLGLALALGWLVARRRLLPNGTGISGEERLAGYAVALVWLGLVAFVTALTSPYALLFVLPSLYAWLWLPLQTRLWARAALFAGGLAGPVLGLLLLSTQLGLSLPRTGYYVLGLVTSGYLPVRSVLLGLAWLVGAAQIAALAFGRYSPYASGLGPVRQALARKLGRRRSYASAR